MLFIVGVPARLRLPGSPYSPNTHMLFIVGVSTRLRLPGSPYSPNTHRLFIVGVSHGYVSLGATALTHTVIYCRWSYVSLGLTTALTHTCYLL